MRDLLRLIGIAVLVFLMVGFAMMYSRDNAFRHGVAAFGSGIWGAAGRLATDLTGGGQDGPELAATALRIARPNQNEWIGLAGFPDQTEVRFMMPPAGGYLSGELDLRFDVQLAQGGDGLLSIAVNGKRRSEIVLDMGHNSYDIVVPLDATDLLQDSIVVGLSARGTTNSGQICPTDSANSGSAINLLPESGLVLTSLSLVDDPETTLIEAATPLMLHLGEDERSQALAVWAAQRMQRAGVAVQLVDDPAVPGQITVVELGEAPVALDGPGNLVLAGRAGVSRAIAFHRADAMAPAALSDWPVEAENLQVETIARSFRGSKRWSLPYQLADMPGGLMPTRLDLMLKASELAEDFDWMVRVSLNGHLLDTARFDGRIEDIALPVDLPPGLQGLSNVISIELIDTSPNESICRAGLDAQAQLLPTTSLVADGPQPADGWGAMVRHLASTALIAPGNTELLDSAQATRAATMLAQFLPAEANVSTLLDEPTTTITALDKAGLEALFAGAPDGVGPVLPRASLITMIGGTTINPVTLHDMTSLDLPALLSQMKSTDVAFIVQDAPAR